MKGGGSRVGGATVRRCRAAVFLDGEYEEAGYYADLARRADLVVAADGGARFLLRHDLRPHVVVGDFDSLPPADRDKLRRACVAAVVHPVRKDMTDGELAVDEALRRGAGEIELAGALGALDHTLGHLAILRRLARRGVVARIATPRLCVRVVGARATVHLSSPVGTRVSVVPFGGDSVVTLEGFDYPLLRGSLPADACLGIGNSVSGRPTRVHVHAGVVVLLVEEGSETFGAGRG